MFAGDIHIIWWNNNKTRTSGDIPLPLRNHSSFALLMDLCFKSMFSLMVRAPLSLSRLGDRDGPVGIQWGYRSYLATTNGQLTNFQCTPLTHKQTSTTFSVQRNFHGSLGPNQYSRKMMPERVCFTPALCSAYPFLVWVTCWNPWKPTILETTWWLIPRLVSGV